jgi:diaminohydroxyphosphoribosylaminopyrimidine deaminase/5-amino-6-(5-phosphoribosylamino)uracil reductase
MHIYKTLIEGGGETISSAVESASINEFYMFISPKIAGGRHAKTPVEGTGIKRITDAVPIKSWKMSKIGRDFLIKARIR